jgi:hypothetical protein
VADQTPVKLVKEFFGMSLPEMKSEWIQRDLAEIDPKKLTDKDKEELASGIGNGSLTY